MGGGEPPPPNNHHMNYGDYISYISKEDKENDQEYYTEWRDDLYVSNLEALKSDMLKESLAGRYIQAALEHNIVMCQKYIDVAAYCNFSKILDYFRSDFETRFSQQWYSNPNK